MDLKEKVIENIRQQVALSNEMQRLQNAIDVAKENLLRLVGAMNVYSDLWREETGDELQKVINTDPEFKAIIDQANVTARSAQPASRSVPQNTSQSTSPQIAPQGSAPKPVQKGTKLVQGNMKLKDPELTGIPRTRDPVRAIVTNDPPPGPPAQDDEEE